MPESPSILFVGLPWDHPFVATLIPDPTVIRDALENMVSSVNSAGYNYTPYYLGPDDEEGMKKFITQLKANQYDAVGIGYGVRGPEAMTVFFEELVNTIKDTLPRAKMLFNSSPQSTLDALRRAYPNV